MNDMRIAPAASPAADTSDLIDLLKRLMGAGPMDVLTVRQIIEPQAAAAAVSNGSGADLQAIREAHEAAAAEATLEGFERWDAVLHGRIFAASRNELLINLHEILSVVRTKPAWLKIKYAMVNDAIREKYCREHGAIVSAITMRNAQAAHEAMKRHLTSVSRDMFPV